MSPTSDGAVPRPVEIGAPAAQATDPSARLRRRPCRSDRRRPRGSAAGDLAPSATSFASRSFSARAVAQHPAARIDLVDRELRPLLHRGVVIGPVGGKVGRGADDVGSPGPVVPSSPPVAPPPPSSELTPPPTGESERETVSFRSIPDLPRLVARSYASRLTRVKAVTSFHYITRCIRILTRGGGRSNAGKTIGEGVRDRLGDMTPSERRVARALFATYATAGLQSLPSSPKRPTSPARRCCVSSARSDATATRFQASFGWRYRPGPRSLLPLRDEGDRAGRPGTAQQPGRVPSGARRDVQRHVAGGRSPRPSRSSPIPSIISGSSAAVSPILLANYLCLFFAG